MFHKTPEVSVNEHPWAHSIKDEHSSKMKYAHNSIRNPHYPKKKESIAPDTKRIRFTIIGDRVTKGFIYCTNLVKGLHKYRKKVFEAPVIQGITTVEWPTVLEGLKAKYGGLAYCLTSPVAVLMNEKFLGGKKELKEVIGSKFSYHLSIDYYKESIAEFAKFITGSGRPFVYMKVRADSKDIGTLIFILYSDILPYTCANFLRLCKDRKGGYSGTPIHRIVKDGWIQGGGFGLKETDLDCENFMIPHDRRGVLGMANSGLHTECSTQFFVLLQPAPWMEHKFVAFGQLIEGKETLDNIEAIPTWYESPTSEIIIYKAEIFNMDCDDIMINKTANEYIDRHIEDLNDLGEVFYKRLLENVFLTAQMRELERLKQEPEEEEIVEGGDDEAAGGLRATKRFNRKKEDIEKQLRTSAVDRSTRPSTAVSRATGSVAPRPASAGVNENNDFDVETYEPEYDEDEYQHQSLQTPSLVVKPTKPFYIPLTDVLYPGEKDSNFDLKRFLQGDYCLETDLKEPSNKFVPHELIRFSSHILVDSESDDDDDDSNEEKEIKKYLKADVDRVSFAGTVIKNIAKAIAKFDVFEEMQKSDLITDERLRRLRIASMDQRAHIENKKVSISIPLQKQKHPHIQRRQTGFVRQEDLMKIRLFSKDEDDDDDEDDDKDDDTDEDEGRTVRVVNEVEAEERVKKVGRPPLTFAPTKLPDGDQEDNDGIVPEKDQKVHIAPPTSTEKPEVQRRMTPFARHFSEDDDDDDDDDESTDDDDDDEPDLRQSVLVRLFDEVKGTEEPPTLKDFKKVSISVPFQNPKPAHTHIQRRQTGFVRKEDLMKLPSYDRDVDDDDDGDEDDGKDNDGGRTVRGGNEDEAKSKKVGRPALTFGDIGPEKEQKVHIAPPTTAEKPKVQRRVTPFARRLSEDDDDDDDDDYKNIDDDDDEADIRQSVLARLFDGLNDTEEPPTLKDYKPMTEMRPVNLLTFSSNNRIKTESEQQRYIRRSIPVENEAFQHVLSIQHGKKLSRKISSDYAKTIDQIEHKYENSIRTVEFAKKRPTISVVEYQKKNRKYQEQKSSQPKWKGLRLPGDTPLHSAEDLRVKDTDKEKSYKSARHSRHLSKVDNM